MTKYKVFNYTLWGDVISPDIVISTDTSKSSLCKKLRLDDPYKIDVDVTSGGVIRVKYDGRPYCELLEVEKEG